MDQHIVAVLQAQLARQPEAMAYSFLSNGDVVDDRLSYSDLDRQARSIAANLQQRGLKQGDRVVLLFCPGLDFIRGFYACLYAGLIAVPVNPPSSTGQSWKNFVSIVDNAGTLLILADQTKLKFMERQGVVHDLKLSQPLVDIASLDSGLADTFVRPSLQAGDVAMLQYTSGSTGIPKGVTVTHANIMHNMRIIQEQIYRGNNVIVSWLPVYHDMGLFGGVLQSVYTGGHYISMPPSSFLMKPLRWIKALSDFQASVSGAPNFAYELCAEAINDADLKGIDLSHWKVAASGAEPVLAPTLRRFGRKFFKNGFNPAGFVPCYGLAESTLLVCANKPDYSKPPTSIAVDKLALKQRRIELVDREAKNAKEYVSCGRPLADQMAIVDPETLVQQPEDAVGEIWIRSPSVSPGYWNNPEKTAEVFGARCGDYQDFYRTGDLGFLHQGEIYIAGRLKDLIIIHGKNHYPGDIERTAQASHDALMTDSGAVFAVEVHGEEHVIIAQEIRQNQVRQVSAGGEALINEIIQAIKDAVSHQHEIHVHGVMLLKPGQVPKTSSGKIRRSACRDLYLGRELESIGEWQSIELVQGLSGQTRKRSVVRIQSLQEITPDSVLNLLVSWVAQRKDQALSEVDIEANHSSLGLDSVDVMSLFGDVTQAMQLNIEPESVQLWEQESLRQLADALIQAYHNQGQGEATSADDGEVEGFL